MVQVIRRGVCCTLLVSLVAFVPPAGAADLKVTYGALGDTAVTVFDNLAGDSDGATGTIVFDTTFIGYTVKGKVTEVITALGATLTLTECMVTRTVAGFVEIRLIAEARIIPPIGPPAECSVSIDGTFVDAVPTGNVSVSMQGDTNFGPIGSLLGPFTSPPPFAGATGVVPKIGAVTNLDMLVHFSLTDNGDQVILPTSAKVSLAATGACDLPGTANCLCNASQAECSAAGGVYLGPGTSCPNPGNCIPALSEWGVAVMILLVLTAATVVLQRRLATA